MNDTARFWCDDLAGKFRAVTLCECGLYFYLDEDGEQVHLSPDCLIVEAVEGEPLPTPTIH